MRAFIFILLFLCTSTLTSVGDIYIYKSYLLTEYLHLISIDKGTNEWMVTSFLLFGLLFAVVSDVKEKIKKNRKQS
ncbi:hypothetical protein [Virgibacillus sp. 6R]|uniref:hypothetical protein n=1 Tax=Metabacillus sp. 22489 TaxID=3453928 RepID=UPI0011A13BD3